MKKLVLFLVVCFAASAVEAGVRFKTGSPGSALAPNVIVGVSYNNSTKNYNALFSANIAGIALWTTPCFVGGVGVSGTGIGEGAFSDFTFAATVPLVTCYAKNIPFQIGYQKPLASSEPQALLDHTFYFGVGIAFGANPAAKSKIWSGKPGKPKTTSTSLDRESEVSRLLALQDSAQEAR